MLDQKGDPYTLVRDFAIIDVSEKDQPGTMTVVMHLLSDDLILGRLKLT